MPYIKNTRKGNTYLIVQRIVAVKYRICREISSSPKDTLRLQGQIDYPIHMFL